MFTSPLQKKILICENNSYPNMREQETSAEALIHAKHDVQGKCNICRISGEYDQFSSYTHYPIGGVA